VHWWAMPSPARASKLESAVAALKSRILALDGSRGRELDALRMVFMIDDELGRLVRGGFFSGPGWGDLQTRLNAVTVSLKGGRDSEALLLFEEVERLLSSLIDVA